MKFYHISNIQPGYSLINAMFGYLYRKSASHSILCLLSSPGVFHKEINKKHDDRLS